MKKVLIATAVMMLPLTACGTADTVTNGSVVENQPAVVMEVSTVNADTMLDQQIFGDATRGDDATKCDAIMNEGLKTECGQIVNAKILTAEAIEKRDKGICKGIELDRYQVQCNMQVDGRVNEDIEIEKRSDLVDSLSAIINKAISEKDVSICELIDIEGQRENCIKNVKSRLNSDNDDILDIEL